MIDFNLNESQKMIVSNLENSLNKNFELRLHNEKAENKKDYKYGWDEIINLGYLGMLSNEENGGFGLGFFEFILTVETWGSKLCEGPYIENSIAIFLLQKFEGNKFKNFICDLTNSKKNITSILSEQYINKKHIPTINKEGERLSLCGKIFNLPYFEEASEVLVLASLNNSLKLLIIPKQEFKIINQSQTIIGQKLFDIELEDITLTENNFIESITTEFLENFFLLHTLSKCSESIGVTESILKMTIEYIKTREQFGEPIGKFQAIQHLASDMYTSINETKELIRYTSKLENKNDLSKYVSLSKIKCNEDLSRIAWSAHQLHGAIGFTWDYGLHLLTKKLLINKTLNGDTLFHSKKI